jgi:hypothetical protein
MRSRKRRDHWKRGLYRNGIGLNRWNNSIIVINWWNLSIDCLRLHLLLPFLRLLFPLPRLSGPALPSSMSSNLDINPNSTTSLKRYVPSSSSFIPISRFFCRKRKRNIYTHKNLLRRTWQTLERSGEAKEWVRGVGEGGDPEKEWVELMERVIKRGFEMEGEFL